MNKLCALGLLLFFFLVTSSVTVILLAAEPDKNQPGDYQPTWTAGKTSVSDISHEEKQKRLGLVFPDWYWQWWDSLPKLNTPPGAKFDPVFDWRTHVGPYETTGVTPVKDQGECAASWAFAAVGALESMVKIYGEVEMNLSEQQVLSCAGYGGGCSGGYPELAYQLFRDSGSVKVECMPYQGNDTIPCAFESCEKWAKISDWTPIPNNVNDLKGAIYNYGPVAVLMAVPETLFSYTEGCFDYDYGDTVNHCVFLVGWNDSMCDGQGAWIAKNSWGVGWGENGFFYIKYGCCLIGTGADVIHYIFHRPYVRLEEYGINDQSGGDGDGRAEPGEAVRLDFTLKNVWSPLGNVTVTVTVDTAGIVIDDNLSNLGNMASKDIISNALDPMQFQIPADFPSRRLYFTFHVSGDSGSGVTYQADTTLSVLVGRDILLVDDDQGADSLGTNYEDYYIRALDSLRLVYDIWDKSTSPDISGLSDYDAVVWFTGNHRDFVFSHADEESLEAYLDGGGRLFMTSQDVVEALSASSDPEDTLFLKNYLHVGYDGNNTKHLVAGYPGDEVGDSLFIYPEGAPGANNQTSKDNLVPDSEADTVLVYSNNFFVHTDAVAGTKFQNDYFRVVIFGFGFEAIRNDILVFQGQYLAKSHFVMRRVLDWLNIPNPAIFVISPNGGENWLTGKAHEILWQSISFEGSVKIEICCINGGDTICSTIVDSTANDGAYSWIVPDITSDCCWVIISDVTDGVPSDTSDSCFSIGRYLCGDCNSDRIVDVGDVVCKINYLFKGGPPPSPIEVCDHNGDGVIDIGDIIAELNYLFRGGHLECPRL